MVDFHSHILPGVDDGSKDVNESIEMLKKSSEMGITTIIATSHCLPSDDDAVADFLRVRDEAYSALMAEICSKKYKLPHIIKGAEVHLTEGISKIANLKDLCIEDTDYILLELPYQKWNDTIFEEIYHLIRRGFRPILAHLDRYMRFEKQFSELLSLNVLCQINASAFLGRRSRRRLLPLFRNDSVHVIGSDMHNLTTRPQNLLEAYNIIESKFGWEYVDFLKNNCERIIKNQETLPTRLPKPGFIKRMFI